ITSLTARNKSTPRKSACWRHLSQTVSLDGVSHLPITKLLYQWHRPDSDMGVTIRQVCRAPAGPSRVLVFAITIASLKPGAADETARVHHAGWRRGGVVAAHGARAAAGNAGGRAPRSDKATLVGGAARSVSPGPERSWLCRGPQRSHRISLGGRPVRSAAGAGRRSSSPSGGRDCHTRWKYGVSGSQGGDHHDSSRV